MAMRPRSQVSRDDTRLRPQHDDPVISKFPSFHHSSTLDGKVKDATPVVYSRQHRTGLLATSTTTTSPQRTKTGIATPEVPPGKSGTAQHFIKVQLTHTLYIRRPFSSAHRRAVDKLKRLVDRRSHVGDGPPHSPASKPKRSGAFLHVLVTHGPLASPTTASRSRPGEEGRRYLCAQGPVYTHASPCEEACEMGNRMCYSCPLLFVAA